jgi:hypothetical protein
MLCVCGERDAGEKNAIWISEMTCSLDISISLRYQQINTVFTCPDFINFTAIIHIFLDMALPSHFSYAGKE